MFRVGKETKKLWCFDVSVRTKTKQPFRPKRDPKGDFFGTVKLKMYSKENP